MDLKVSPAAEDTSEAKAPLLDLEAVERRVRRLETTPDQKTIDATLSAIATREPTSFHQATIYFGLRDDTPPRRKYGFLAISVGIVFLQCFVAVGVATAEQVRARLGHERKMRTSFPNDGDAAAAALDDGAEIHRRVAKVPAAGDQVVALQCVCHRRVQIRVAQEIRPEHELAVPELA